MFIKGFSLKFAAYLLFVLAFSNFSLANKIIYVDDDANGLNDGSSWQNAYTFLQEALTEANSSEKPVEIHVAQGIYKPYQRNVPYFDKRSERFFLINDVTIKGGYAGINEPDPNSRSIELYKSILSGDVNGDDIEVDDPAELFKQTTYRDNSLCIVISFGNDANAVLDGFIIKDGYNIADYDPGPGGGAGMLISRSNPTIANCTFTENVTTNYGGGILILSSNPTIINCILTKNYAYSGAGIYSGFGGYHSPAPSNPIIINCVFNNNYAYYGSGLYNYRGKPKLSNCTFKSNVSENPGAGIYSYDNMEIKDCNFIQNTASSGGGIASDANLTLENCIFTGNRALGYSAGGGGACRLFGVSTIITNCTFSGNWAQQNRTIVQKNSSLIRINNSIIWDGQNTLSQSGPSSLLVKYSDIQGSLEGEGNIDVDPLFVNAGYWVNANDPNIVVEPKDTNVIWVDGYYHLKSQAGRFDPETQTWVQDDVTSPCIDTGDPNSPIGLEPFPNGGRINMGAYGGTSEASKSHFGKPVCTTIVAGDINGDCKVDVWDFEIMLLHWLEEH